MSDSDSPPEFCYRCRKGPPETKKFLFECQYCPLLWHASCLPRPFNLVFEGDWMCPQHNEHLLSTRNRKTQTDIELSEEIAMYETADKIMKYGGVTYSVPAKSIEDKFLNYTRRFRRYSSQSIFFVNNQKASLETKYNEHNLKPNETETDGIQMLLDAAKEIEYQPIEEDREEKKYKAIEELVNLIGEDNLLEMLSK